MNESKPILLDIVMPVHNEGLGISPVIKNIFEKVKTPFRLLLCYDTEEDNTLGVVRKCQWLDRPVAFVKNKGEGVHRAITSGFEESRAPYVVVYAADDLDNADILDSMVKKAEEGNEIVAASRFIQGGCMVNCRWTKSAIVRFVAWSLFYIARVPVHDATNGFRLFSNRILRSIPLESKKGFTYSLELLVKAHRLGWPIAEVPSRWFERKKGKSRFQILNWALPYGRWYWYAFETTLLRKRSADLSQVSHQKP